MPGVTLNDIANEGIQNEELEHTSGLPIGEPDIELQEPSRFNELMKKVITAPTGEGSISEYMEHPMNFKRSQGLAQIIRGFTGIIGNLNLAIIDIVFGYLRFTNEGKGAIINDGNSVGGVGDVR